MKEKDYSKVGHIGSTEDRRDKAIEDGIRNTYHGSKVGNQIYNDLLGFYPLTEEDKKEIEEYRKKQAGKL
ncbi:MAG: hypothetical protein LBD11_03515 [Candidatus Peribacteria bacterium]|jgi:hypothetical protein|nr:hypothetical protein [Candidatus Peribacteria bacterium]